MGEKLYGGGGVKSVSPPCPSSKIKKSNLFLYANSCFVSQAKDVKETEKQLNRDFKNICEWFVDNKPNKNKSILFLSMLLNVK